MSDYTPAPYVGLHGGADGERYWIAIPKCKCEGGIRIPTCASFGALSIVDGPPAPFGYRSEVGWYCWRCAPGQLRDALNSLGLPGTVTMTASCGHSEF